MNNKIQFILLACIIAIAGANAKNMNTKNTTAASATAGEVIKNGKMVYTEITINAAPAKVWQVLTDFEAYPAWNPFIKSIKGKPAVGQHIEALLQVPGSKGMVFKPRVLQFQQCKEFRWIGKLGVGYLFDGEHTFRLQDNGNGTTTFMQYEHFRGILIPFMKKMLDVQTAEGFGQMNQKLKERVEGL
jgi:hypothetical protein